ncbi:hypothetical protein N0V95_003508 [Ascochyta clinopodiicola]|nr:hypothetical protein N0V95_003508 [Ascochyta clinopodiicola]
MDVALRRAQHPRTFIDPTVILVSTKIDDIVIDRFDPEAMSGESVNSDNDQFRLAFLLDVRPPSEFSYDAARGKLMTLRLGENDGTRVSFNVPGDHLDGYEDGGVPGQQGQLLRLAGWIDVESRITFAFHALKIKDALRDVLGGDNLAIKAKVFEKFESHHLAQVGRKISETIDFEKSAEERRTVILPGIDEELDHMKRTLDGLENILNRVAGKLSEKMPPELRASLNVIYFPQIGFLVVVPMDPATGAAMYEGSFESPWELMFSAEGHIYFKTAEVREMDDHFGDVYGIISDREIEISHELAQFVLHDVQDHSMNHEQGASMLVLTGPNYSGKSVYLKQVALITFMAHVGCFVPAESAKIGLTDKILSRVTTRETVSRAQSAFMIDLQQISLAINLATRRSLLIIDEFGKGTDASDGAGLACAVMEYLLSLKHERPKVIGATHFHGKPSNLYQVVF